MIAKLETEMNTKDLKLLIGNLFLHRHLWMVISIIRPPKQSKGLARQQEFDF
jgi:hypothetical protein